MWDLVGNPEDRFSHKEAHLLVVFKRSKLHGRVSMMFSFSSGVWLFPHEPRCEKTGLRGMGPGPTQTRLYNHTRWLEA